MNLSFIFQSFICISIRSNQKNELKSLFEQNEINDIVEQIQYDAMRNELNDESNENILYFNYKINLV